MVEEYLRRLIAPLGVYSPEEDGPGGAELHALGQGLDALGERLAAIEREALTATAQEEGLSRREALFSRRPAALTAQERRAAIAALLQIDGDSLTPAAIDTTLRGCGVWARAEELDGGRLRVSFPGVAGVPAEFDQMKKIILDILPCHLETVFFFRYLTWAQCEAEARTWAGVEAAGHTWKSFQLSLPPEDDPGGDAFSSPGGNS